MLATNTKPAASPSLAGSPPAEPAASSGSVEDAPSSAARSSSALAGSPSAAVVINPTKVEGSLTSAALVPYPDSSPAHAGAGLLATSAALASPVPPASSVAPASCVALDSSAGEHVTTSAHTETAPISTAVLPQPSAAVAAQVAHQSPAVGSDSTVFPAAVAAHPQAVSAADAQPASNDPAVAGQAVLALTPALTVTAAQPADAQPAAAVKPKARAAISKLAAWVGSDAGLLASGFRGTDRGEEVAAAAIARHSAAVAPHLQQSSSFPAASAELQAALASGFRGTDRGEEAAAAAIAWQQATAVAPGMQSVGGRLDGTPHLLGGSVAARSHLGSMSNRQQAMGKAYVQPLMGEANRTEAGRSGSPGADWALPAYKGRTEETVAAGSDSEGYVGEPLGTDIFTTAGEERPAGMKCFCCMHVHLLLVKLICHISVIQYRSAAVAAAAAVVACIQTGNMLCC